MIFHRSDEILSIISFIYFFFFDFQCLYDTDSPVLLSFPHFYMGDPRLRAAVQGMDEPDPELHEFYLDVQPVSIHAPVMLY